MVRTGQGIEPFYERLGYRAIGRHPRAIAVAPDDVRDEVVMSHDVNEQNRASGRPARLA